jgi:MFS family permease
VEKTQSQTISQKKVRFSLREQLMLSGLMMQSVMALIDVSMFNVAVPTIQDEFGLPVDTVSLVVAIRYLPRLGLMPIYGVIGDRLGKKKTYLAGLIIFIIGSLVGLLSPNLNWLVAGRFLQGVGGASLPLSMALITDAFAKDRRGRALGVWNAAAPAGSMIGPVLGGFIIEAFGWKSIFIVVIIGSSLAWFAIKRLVPTPPKNELNQPNFDWTGSIGLMILATSFLMATTTSSVVPFGSLLNYVFWAFTALGLLILIMNARRNPNPLIGFDEVRNPRLILPAIAVNFRMIAHTGTSFLLVLYITNVFGKSPSAVGTFILFYSLSAMIGVPLGGMLADRWISRKAGSFGLSILAVGMLWLWLVQGRTNHIILLPGMILGGLGAGLCLIAFTKEAVASLGEEKVGLASGLYNMLRFTGASLSTPILGLILAAAYERYAGGEMASGPYQLGFQVLTITTIVGVIVAASIPSPQSEPDSGERQDV